MSELEKAAWALLEKCADYRFACEHHGGGDRSTGRAWDLMVRAEEALEAALEAEAGWGTDTHWHPHQRRLPDRELEPGYEYRMQRRPLVDYSRDQALHPHEGDGDICSRCGEHRSWHDG